MSTCCLGTLGMYFVRNCGLSEVHSDLAALALFKQALPMLQVICRLQKAEPKPEVATGAIELQMQCEQLPIDL